MDVIRIVPTSEEHIAGFHSCLDAVARERRFIGLIEAPPLAKTREFIQRLLEGAGVQVLALDPSDRVVGWCDIVRIPHDGFRHCGRLGMGLLSNLRGHGIGRRLAESAIEAARAQGLERIELEVFASNGRAIALYERLGFVREGVKLRARKLDGRYDDDVIMALLLHPSGSDCVGRDKGSHHAI